MNLIPSAVSKAVARQGLLARKNSPTILFGAGLVGMVSSTVLACRATLQLSEEFHKTKNDLEIAKSIEHYHSENDRQKDVTLIYARCVFSIGKLYAPSILLGAASIGCLAKSHNILQERNLALMAAYTAVDEAFTRYRAKVVEKYGEDEDRNLRYESEKMTIVDDGSKRDVKVLTEENEHSMYSRFFDEYSDSWSKEPEYNFVFLLCQQQWANDMLRARGHLFLNEVYDTLGLTRTRAGSIVGWVMGDEGDNQVDFGIFEGEEPNVRDFVNGRNASILLDFNVDGVIWDRIPERDRGERLKWQS